MTDRFSFKAGKKFTQSALLKLVDRLIDNPKRGVILQKTGGLIRKIRSSFGRGKGQRTGARVLYHYDPNCALLILLDFFEKSVIENISSHDLKAIMRLLDKMKKDYVNDKYKNVAIKNSA